MTRPHSCGGPRWRVDRRTGVTVNSVLAGPTLSEGAGHFMNAIAKAKKTDGATVEAEFFKPCATSLLKRFASTDEVAAMVVYLCGVPPPPPTARVRVDAASCIHCLTSPKRNRIARESAFVFSSSTGKNS